MNFWRFLLFPFAFIYAGITSLRNGFYRKRIFKSSKFSLPIISVGNLSMGGTGKTPHAEYLIRLLQDDFKVFTLSRGFGRKKYGFIIADQQSDAHQIGDEPLQYQLKFGAKIGVAVDANRVNGVMEICRSHPETELILLDDAYQHRAIHAGLSILITSFEDPFYTDFIVPVGRLREGRWGKNRADIIIVSKSPSLSENDKGAIIAKINPHSHQKVFFSSIKYGDVHSLINEDVLSELKDRLIVLVTGIANARPLSEFLGVNNTVLHHFEFGDHYNFKRIDIHRIHNLFDKFANREILILTTEKDAMRLLNKEIKQELNKYPWYYQEIIIEIDKASEFKELVLDYVEKNS